MAATIIVETGLEVANANSYVTLAEANTFFQQVANSVWDGLDNTDEKIPFIIAAQRYMAQAFRMRWLGYRHTNTQPLDWPRLWVNQFDAPGNYGPYPLYYAPTVIPQQIKDAQCMLAVKLANGDLAPDIERVTESEQVGPIKVTYAKGFSTVTIFRDVELLLAPFFKSTGMNAVVSRA